VGGAPARYGSAVETFIERHGSLLWSVNSG
jgi:hypothetical protein